MLWQHSFVVCMYCSVSHSVFKRQKRKTEGDSPGTALFPKCHNGQSCTRLKQGTWDSSEVARTKVLEPGAGPGLKFMYSDVRWRHPSALTAISYVCPHIGLYLPWKNRKIKKNNKSWSIPKNSLHLISRYYIKNMNYGSMDHQHKILHHGFSNAVIIEIHFLSALQASGSLWPRAKGKASLALQAFCVAQAEQAGDTTYFCYTHRSWKEVTEEPGWA